jgi:REP element-mobilizing transposase RayT
MIDHEPLEYGNYYHIFNRGINRESIFVEESNYQYFLKLIKKHILGTADLFAYCLLKNHFHLLVRIKSEEEMMKDLGLSSVNKDLPNPSQKFSNLFNAYSKAFNKRYNRTGSLFERPFRRISISTDEQLIQLVVYIHRNPEKHELVDDFRVWPYSSCLSYQLEDTIIKREELIRWFGSNSGFEDAHEVDETF